MLYQVTVYNICAAVRSDITDSMVIEAAPIFHRWLGKTVKDLRSWVEWRGGRLEKVNANSPTSS